MRLNLFGRRTTSEKAVLNASTKKTPAQRSESIAQTTIESLARMRETIKNLEKRENFLTVKANAQFEEAIAKDKEGDKKGAISAMTRKKLFESEAMKVVQMKTNLEAQMLSIESANISLVAQEGMQVGLNAQKQVTKNLKPDDIAELHQDIEDHLNQADEASAILAGGFNAGEVFDEDELLAELAAELSSQSKQQPSATAGDNDEAALERLMESLPTISVGTTLPQAPTEALVLSHEDSSYDLKKLQAEMGL